MRIILLSLILFSLSCFAEVCKPPQYLSWSKEGGEVCTTRITSDDPQNCLPQIFPQLSTFEKLVHKGQEPWWVASGEALFPNLHYPGVWKNDQMDASFYSGSGEVFAAKPNVYIQSIHDEKRMSFEFVGGKAKHFLATSPVLSERLSWDGKIVEKDKFEIEGVYYDYLFYDIRLPKSAMQFTHGICATRSESIEWMLKDLEILNFSSIALSDFEDHWKVKIPDYPYFCVYPQYNRELDEEIPVRIHLEQASLTRALYLLVPYKEAPDSTQLPLIPLPTNDPNDIRPSVKITRENMFKEWGVAFLGE